MDKITYKNNFSSALDTIRPLIFVFVSFFIITLFFVGVIFVSDEYAKATDFLSYYTATSLIREGKGEFLYYGNEQKDFQHRLLGIKDTNLSLPFKGLPPAAIFYLPFTNLPYTLAYRLFVFLNILGLFAFIYLLIRKLNVEQPRLLFVVSLLFYPSVFAIRSGQLSVFFAFVSLGIYWFLKDKPTPAGFLSSFLVVKPQFIFFWPFFVILAKGKKDFLKGLLSGVILMGFLSVFISGWEILTNYPLFLLTTESLQYGSNPFRLYTFNSFLVNVGFSFLNAVIVNAAAYLLFLFIFFKSHKKVGFESGFSASLLISMAFSVHLQPHDMVLLLFPVFVLSSFFVKKGGKDGALRLISAIFLFFSFSIANSTSPFLASFIFLAVSLVFLNINPVKLFFRVVLK